MNKPTSMDPLRQTKLDSIMQISTGDPKIRIGVIDGPLDLSHPAFHGSRIRTVKDSQVGACRISSSIACMHGTFVVGILAAKRGDHVPAICPNCEILLYPIFRDNEQIKNKNIDVVFPASTPEELSNAIIETIDAGANVINLSLGLSSSSLIVYPELQEAYDYACNRGVIIVAAAGNQGNIGFISLLNHSWIIPVTACDENGQLSVMSNYGPSIANRGLMAPGINITSTFPGGQYTQMSGTSFAAPFVTGAIALLWSLFPKANAAEIVHSIIRTTSHNRRSIVPPLINSEAAYNVLKNGTY
jgi:subtilisin family serine protease